MDKIKIGLPKSFFYYYHGYFLKNFFEYLNFDVIVSPDTNREIIDLGMNKSNDEMCMSFKVFLGHVAYLDSRCDYIINMRIDNYGLMDQMCTNFLASYDIVHNLVSIPILDINIDFVHKKTLYKSLKKLSRKFSVSQKTFKEAYQIAVIKTDKYRKGLITRNMNLLYGDGLKLLVVAHSYNIYDSSIGKPIIDYLESNGIEVVYCDRFPEEQLKGLSKKYSPNLYWYYSKENIGSIVLSKKYIDGVIFISSFPCGPDSLVNELVIRKFEKPYLNIVVDDVNSLTGIETRLESFIDILEQKIQ